MLLKTRYSHGIKPPYNVTSKKASAYSFLTLVKANKAYFTTRQIKRVDAARGFRKHVGYPGYKSYFKRLETNYDRNCPLTVDDVKRTLHIYGHDVESLKGKTTRKTPDQINDGVTIEIPPTIKDLHSQIHSSADYFFVQGIAFLHSISRGCEFRTIEHHKDFKKNITRAIC